jgi:hypothetical protein
LNIAGTALLALLAQRPFRIDEQAAVEHCHRLARGPAESGGVADGEEELLPMVSFGGRAKRVDRDALRAHLVRLDTKWASAGHRVDQADAFRKRLGSRYAEGF